MLSPVESVTVAVWPLGTPPMPTVPLTRAKPEVTVMFSVYVLPLVTKIGPIDPLYPPHTPLTVAVMVSLVALPVAFAQSVYVGFTPVCWSLEVSVTVAVLPLGIPLTVPVMVASLPLHEEPAAMGTLCGADASRTEGERRMEARLTLARMRWHQPGCRREGTR